MFCIRLGATGGEDRELVSLPVTVYYGVPCLWSPFPIHAKPSCRRMRYQNDRQGALSQLPVLTTVLGLLSRMASRTGFVQRMHSTVAVEGECSPVMTSNHPACPREMVQGMKMGEWARCEACSLKGACVDVRGALAPDYHSRYF
jgi:hypothetical protein